MRGIHHLHIRKRLSKNLEPFPASSPSKRLLDTVVYAAGIVGPLMTLPQIFEIYAHRNASGVSAVTWAAYALFDIPWIIYGIAHRETPIVVTYVLWFIFNTVVVIGALVYG